MRVLFITNVFLPAYTGGAEVSNYHTLRGLIRRGVTCEMLFVNNRMARTTEDWYELDGIPVHRFDFFTRRRTALGDVFDPRIYRTVQAELKRFRPDIVHVQNVSGATLAPYVACHAAGVPVVNTLHDHWLLCPNNMLYREDASLCDVTESRGRCAHCFRRYDFWGDVPYRRAVLAALTRNVDAFISPSQATIELHVRAGYARSRFRHVPHAFPDGPLPPLAQYTSETGDQARTVVFFGGGLEIKGAGVLLAALPELLRQIPNLRVIVAGSGEDLVQAEFKRFAPAVDVIGFVPFDETRALMNAADLTLVPSTCHESFSLVTLESLLSGTPVVGSAFGGIAEIIREGEDGYLIPVGDAAALVEKVVAHFAQSPAQRRQLRQRCRRDALARFSMDLYLDRVQAVYREVLG
ncbi:MAG: glycosyltransferase [Anaerolineae bacterium]